MVRIAVFAFILAAMVVSDAIACGGAGQDYAVDIRSAKQGGAMIATLTSANGETREILDDTGYVGIDLALSQIYSFNLKSGDLKVDQSSRALEFIRSRIPSMKSAIEKTLSDPKHAESLAETVKSIDQFARIAKSREVTYTELDDAFGEVADAFQTHKVPIAAATRKNPSDAWGKAIPYGALNLPPRIRPGTKLRGCGDKIGKFSVQQGGQNSAAAPDAGALTPKSPVNR